MSSCSQAYSTAVMGQRRRGFVGPLLGLHGLQLRRVQLMAVASVLYDKQNVVLSLKNACA